MEKVIKLLVILDISRVWNLIITTLNSIYDLLFNRILIALGEYEVPIGDIFITIILISILLKIVLTLRARNVETIITSTERRLRKK